MKRVVLATALLVGPMSVSASNSANLNLAIASALGGHADFVSAAVDLNQDAHSDAVAIVHDAKWCGSGGCVMLIFKGTPNGYTLVSRSTVTSPPVRILASSHSGWKDLIVHSNGTGDVLLRFNGSKYPDNPSLQPAATPQQLRSAIEILGNAPNNSFKPNSSASAAKSA